MTSGESLVIFPPREDNTADYLEASDSVTTPSLGFRETRTKNSRRQAATSVTHVLHENTKLQKYTQQSTILFGNNRTWSTSLYPQKHLASADKAVDAAFIWSSTSPPRLKPFSNPLQLRDRIGAPSHLSLPPTPSTSLFVRYGENVKIGDPNAGAVVLYKE